MLREIDLISTKIDDRKWRLLVNNGRLYMNLKRILLDNNDITVVTK